LTTGDRRRTMGDFTREKSAAVCWLLLFILMVGGAAF
jgi:hypothetical protein